MIKVAAECNNFGCTLIEFNLMQTNIFPIEMKRNFWFLEFILNLVNMTLVYTTPLDITAHF